MAFGQLKRVGFKKKEKKREIENRCVGRSLEKERSQRVFREALV
jgi:hypothetical protein